MSYPDEKDYPNIVFNMGDSSRIVETENFVLSRKEDLILPFNYMIEGEYLSRGYRYHFNMKDVNPEFSVKQIKSEYNVDVSMFDFRIKSSEKLNSKVLVELSPLDILHINIEELNISVYIDLNIGRVFFKSNEHELGIDRVESVIEYDENKKSLFVKRP